MWSYSGFLLCKFVVMVSKYFMLFCFSAVSIKIVKDPEIVEIDDVPTLAGSCVFVSLTNESVAREYFFVQVSDRRINGTSMFHFREGYSIRNEMYSITLAPFAINTYESTFYQCGVFDPAGMRVPVLSKKKLLRVKGKFVMDHTFWTMKAY